MFPIDNSDRQHGSMQGSRLEFLLKRRESESQVDRTSSSPSPLTSVTSVQSSMVHMRVVALAGRSSNYRARRTLCIMHRMHDSARAATPQLQPPAQFALLLLLLISAKCSIRIASLFLFYDCFIRLICRLQKKRENNKREGETN